MKRLSALVLGILLAALVLFLPSGSISADVVHTGTITDNETWGAGTHYVSGGVMVPQDLTLTISAGAVVKFAPGTSLDVYGTLDVNGTSGNMVIFTSLMDDTFGGDTNGDGSATSPAPGDWGGIHLNGSDVNQGIGEFDWCRVRYGACWGNPASVHFYYSDSGHFSNSISEFSADRGIELNNSSPTISGSTVNNNGTCGLMAYSFNGIINDSDFTGNNECGLKAVDFNGTLTNNYFGGNGDYGVGFTGVLHATSAYTGNSFSGNGRGDGFAVYENVAGELSGPDTLIIHGVSVANGATLTVPAGTILKFAPGTSLDVYGTLDVSGTSGNMVIFTSLMDDTFGGDTNGDGSATSPAPGDWGGIHLNGSDVNQGIGEFDWCRVRYGACWGNPASVHFYYSDSGHFSNSVSEFSADRGIELNNSSPTISGSTVNNNGTCGLMAYSFNGIINDSDFTGNNECGLKAVDFNGTLTNNYFGGNGDYGVGFTGVLHPASAYTGNYFSGNGRGDGFAIYENVAGELSGPDTYIIAGASVPNGAALTVPAGTIVKFSPGGSLDVYGTLDVNGTSDNMVIFTSLRDDTFGGDTNGDGSATSPSPGDWGWINLEGSDFNRGIGEFDWCWVRYGGGWGPSANVRFNYSDSGHFANSISEGSASHGLEVRNCAPTIADSALNNNVWTGLAAFSFTGNITNNAFTGNGQHGASFTGILDSTYEYTGNTFSGNAWGNAFAIWGDISGELRAADLYIIQGASVPTGGTLTIPAGTIVKFAPGASLTVYGALDVNGTSGDMVIFTSLMDDTFGGDTNGDGSATSPSPGDWGWINLEGSDFNRGIGEFDWCWVRYGGGWGPSANVRFNYSDSGHFANSISEGSASHGLEVRNCAPTIADSTLNNNTSCGLVAFSFTGNITNNAFTGNGQHGASFTGILDSTYEYTGNTFSGNAWGNAFAIWGDISGELEAADLYIIQGASVPTGGTLTIPSGTIVKFASGASLSVYGTLNANGVAGDRVIFTSLKDDTFGGDTNGDGGASHPDLGDWSMINLEGSGFNNGIGLFNWCTIRYGGGWGAPANLRFSGSDSGVFSNSISEQSANRGIEVNNCSPFIIGSELSNNYCGIYVTGVCSSTISLNRISDNDIGITIDNSSGNQMSQNSFIDNGSSAFLNNAAGNTWDDGYPSGGNYWSDFAGLDEYSGPNQDQPGSDGIGDTPYIIDPYNQDHYPLMEWVDTMPPPVPTLVYPANGTNTADNTPWLDWSDVTDPSGVHYQLQVDDNADFSSPVVNKTWVSLSSTTLAELPQGVYYWRVRAVDGAGNASDWTEAWSLTVTPAVPTLVYPANGTRTKDNTPWLDWTDVSGDTPIHYQLQVDDNADFSSLVVNKTWVSLSSNTLAMLPDGLYYWRVRAVNAAGIASNWSGARAFRIDTVAPPVPTLIYPVNGKVPADNTPWLDWSDVTDVTGVRYQLQVDDNADFSSLVVNKTSVSLSSTTLPVLPDGVYYWRVRAVDGVGNASAWSGAWSFTVVT